MSATSAKLLQVAAEIVGGEKELAGRLGISAALMAAYLDDRRPLPDALLLRAVDIILNDRHPGAKRGDSAMQVPSGAS